MPVTNLEFDGVADEAKLCAPQRTCASPCSGFARQQQLRLRMATVSLRLAYALRFIAARPAAGCMYRAQCVQRQCSQGAGAAEDCAVKACEEGIERAGSTRRHSNNAERFT